jgi:hypothetical protein
MKIKFVVLFFVLALIVSATIAPAHAQGYTPPPPDGAPDVQVATWLVVSTVCSYGDNLWQLIGGPSTPIGFAAVFKGPAGTVPYYPESITEALKSQYLVKYWDDTNGAVWQWSALPKQGEWVTVWVKYFNSGYGEYKSLKFPCGGNIFLPLVRLQY